SFKNVQKDVREIGAKLNVQTVMEGSVRKAGNQLRVTAQLIDVRTGYHLLSRSYTRELRDVFEVQEELANAVVQEIMPQVRGAAGPAAALQVQPVDLGAYNLYLKGMVTLARDFTSPKTAIANFQQALGIDPNYGPAYAGLAYAHFHALWYGYLPPDEGV